MKIWRWQETIYPKIGAAAIFRMIRLRCGMMCYNNQQHVS